VVAGTAGAVRHHQDQKYQSQAEQQAYEQQAAAAPAPAAAPAVDPVTAQIQQLAALHASGAISDEEFAAAKAKALGI
jgi:membrane protease subunit (stomatin/prohibitin family)